MRVPLHLAGLGVLSSTSRESSPFAQVTSCRPGWECRSHRAWKQGLEVNHELKANQRVRHARNGIDTNPLGNQISCQGTCESHDGAFRCGIIDHAGRAAEGCNRAVVDDARMTLVSVHIPWKSHPEN